MAAIQQIRLTGLGGGLTSEAVSTDVQGNQTISQRFIDRATQTETIITDYPDAQNDAVEISEGGLLKSSQGKNGATTTYGYDALGRRTQTTDPRTGTATTHYDANGRVDWVSDAAMNYAYYDYNPDTGRLTISTDQLGGTTRYAYDDLGNIVKTWGNAAYPTETIYDGYGRMVEMRTWRDEGLIDWNAADWPASPGAADSTKWHYQESTGLLTAKEDAAAKSVVYAYFPGGKLSTRTWARLDGASQPLITAYSYDPATGELTNIDYSDATPPAIFTYDRLGRQKTVADAAGTRTFSYNPNTLLLETEEIAGAINATISRTYEEALVGALGRPKGFFIGGQTAPDYSATYGFDPAAGRFSSIAYAAAGASGSAVYEYVPDSDLIETRTMGLQTTTYGYEANRNLKTQIKNEYDAALVSQYDYRYDETARRTSVLNQGQAFARLPNAFNLYGYNDRSEIHEAARYLGSDVLDPSNPVQPEYRLYDYDSMGNRTQITLGTNSGDHERNELNQYVLRNLPGGGQENYAYDLDGNLTAMQNSGTATKYQYDAENRLMAIQPETPANGDKKTEFSYDYMGRRIRKTIYEYQASAWSKTAENFFLYNGWNLVQEISSTQNLAINKYYVWGLDLSQSMEGAGGIGGLTASVETLYGDSDGDGDVDGSDLAKFATSGDLSKTALFAANFGKSNAAAATINYYLYDANGNIGQLVEAQGGTINAHYEYDPYGNIVYSDGPKAASNSFRFSTKYQDDETGLVYYGYRYYSPELGRWLNRDPIGEEGGKNLFGFVLNNPIMRVDPFGEFGIFAHTDGTGHVGIQVDYNGSNRNYDFGRYQGRYSWSIYSGPNILRRTTGDPSSNGKSGYKLYDFDVSQELDNIIAQKFRDKWDAGDNDIPLNLKKKMVKWNPKRIFSLPSTDRYMKSDWGLTGPNCVSFTFDTLDETLDDVINSKKSSAEMKCEAQTLKKKLSNIKGWTTLSPAGIKDNLEDVFNPNPTP